MGRRSSLCFLLAVSLLVVACSPVTAGPKLPRPPQPGPIVTTTLPPTTTTTVDELALARASCPTDFCLLYSLHPEAVWSDGVGVSAADFAATVEAYTDPVRGVDPLYEMVEEVEGLADGSVRVAFSQPVGEWQTLFSRLVPAHDDSGIGGPTLGPFRFAEWVPGDRIVLVEQSTRWHSFEPLSGEPWGDVRRVTFVFIPDLDDMVAALEDGDVDVIVARAEEGVIDALDSSEFGLALAPGEAWEHIDFHHDDPLLSQRWVREVFDLAIDRQGILDVTVRLIDPDATSLSNTVWMANDHRYESHYSDRHDPEAAEQILIDNGCTKPEDVYVCQGTEMRFVWTSTNDDPARLATFQAVSDDLALIGVELLPDLRRPSSFITREHLFGGPDSWQMIDFSWRVPDDAWPNDATYQCADSDLNVNRYCSPEIEALIQRAAIETDPVARAKIYNEVDTIYLDDLAVIPLYQKLDLMAWNPALSGPAPNYTYSGDVWNLGAWSGLEEVVIALPEEPLSLDPLERGDEAADTVLGLITAGVFGMDPSHRFEPVVVESVEVVEP